MADILDGFEEASEQVYDRLPFLVSNKDPREGDYVLELEKVVNQKGKVGVKPFFKIEVRVLEAKGENTHPVGARLVHMVSPDEWGYHLKEIIGITGAALKIPVTKVTRDDVATLVDSDPAGIKLKGRVFRKNGEPDGFLKAEFSAL